MKSSHLLTIATFSVMAAGTAMALSSRLDPLPGADATEMLELTSGMLIGEGAEAAEDSAVVLSPDSLATLAGEAFKAYRISKFDGEEDAVLYPRLYDLYEQALAAFDAQPNATRGFMQCRDILKQIDDELLRGAFFYSSNSRREELNKFARAYLDIQQLPRMEGERWKRDEQVYPFICYIAASSAYNASEWDKAIDYFKLFLSTGASDRREQVYQFMGRACLSARNYPLAITVMQEAMKAYPQNEMLPMIGIQACVDGGHGQFLQDFLTRALELKPTDVQLMTLQGQLYEDRNDYRAAIALFNDLDRLKPNSMSITKHLGTNYYNMAVSAFNNAINEPNEKEAKRLRRQARNYFDAAALKFRAILESDPTATKYMRSLGVWRCGSAERWHITPVDVAYRIGLKSKGNQHRILMGTVHAENMVSRGFYQFIPLGKPHRLQHIGKLGNVGHAHAVGMPVKYVQGHSCNYGITHGVLLEQMARS